MPNFILSPCGISALTNSVSNYEDRRLLNQYANHREKPDGEVGKQLDALIDDAKATLASASFEDATRLSAELNALIKFYEGQFDQQDSHTLLCTDTWLGETAANMIKAWMNEHGLTNVHIRRQRDLQTHDILSFQLALSDLVRYCEEVVKGYRSNGYSVLFNLTGGFKSVQGFLQTLATFYADESFYVFESNDRLLYIPTLPIKMNTEQDVLDNVNIFRRLDFDLNVNLDEVEQIPDTLLLIIDDNVSLSPWGELVWQNTKEDMLGRQLYDSPSKQVVYGAKLRDDVEKLDKDRMYWINHRITQLAKHMESNRTYNPDSLNVHRLQGKSMAPSTHEFYAWSDRDAARFYGYFEGNTFVIDKFAPHLR